MFHDLLQFIVLAQDGAAEGEQGSSSFLDNMMVPMIAIGFLLYFLLIRPDQKRQKAHKAMLENIKQNDRVIISGGIKGVVVKVDSDADDVVVRIDESTGAKVHVTVGSIARVVVDDDSKSKDK